MKGSLARLCRLAAAARCRSLGAAAPQPSHFFQPQLQQQPWLLAGGRPLWPHSSSSILWKEWRACMSTQQQQQLQQQQIGARNRQKIIDNGMYLGAVVLGMVALSYASVPLYRAFCQATGYGGTIGRAANIEQKVQSWQQQAGSELERRAAQRQMRVWFSADVAEDLPWRFKPTQDYVTVHPGQSTLAFFTAENKSDHAITGVSTYNVTPDKAAYYFNKIQCFCFEEQRLQPREVVDMPVFFYIDPELVDDFNCRNIHDITLAYTFFRVDSDEDEEGAVAAAPGSGVKLHGPGTWSSGAVMQQQQQPPAAAAPAAAAATPSGSGSTP